MEKLLPILLALHLIAGCSSAIKRDSKVKVGGGRYSAAFDAARESLIARRFELDRVDARAGVITTKPKSTSGVATPWDTEQSNFDQEVEDLFNRQQRLVRITFEPVGAGDSPPEDLRTVPGDLTARVEVVVERLHRPGWQIQPESVRFSSTAQDPAMGPRGMWPTYAVPFSQDPDFASRLAAEIERRLNGTRTAQNAAN